MAIDPHSPRSAVPELGSHVIENEVPAYRALAPTAIVSLIFGLASILTFTSPSFALLGVLGIILGVVAQRAIRRMPDVYDGQKLASAGIATSLLFVLSALTMQATQQWLSEREAWGFGQKIVKAMESGDYEQVVYYFSPDVSRKGKTPGQLVKEMNEQQQNPHAVDERVDPIKTLESRLKESDQKVRLWKLAGVVQQNMTTHASMLIEIKGPATKAFPEPVQYAAVICRGEFHDGEYHWLLDKVIFPTTPKI